MKVLNLTGVTEWFASVPDRGSEDVHEDAGELFFAHPEANCVDVEYPSKVEQLPFLARFLATVGYESQDFRGAILWFTGWGVWNPLDEGPGYRIVEAIRAAAGQPMSFEAAPGHHFRAGELDQAVGMLLQPMIFGWDAYYFPVWSYGYDEFFLHVSHDSYVTVVTRTKEFYEKAFGLLKETGLNPRPGDEAHAARFCRR